MTDSEKEFVRNNLKADVNALLLNPPKGYSENIKYLADQIKARQKAKGKLPTWCANFDLIFPPPLSIEQCSSEIAAKNKSKLVFGDTFIDLTGGMGIDCLAFSEQFKRTIYVEQNKDLVSTFEHNCKVLGQKIEMYNEDAASFLSKLEDGDATVFLDPARRDNHSNKVFKFSDCSPNVVELLPTIRSKASKLIIKASPLIDLKLGIEELEGVSEIHVMSISNECKEVVFVLDFKAGLSKDPEIQTINIQGHNEQMLSFTLTKEQSSLASLGELQDYLLIPNASILKAGGFKFMAQQFNLAKLGTDTHLYTSNEIIGDFPGRQFEIIESSINKVNLKRRYIERLNVITRNYPQSPNEILKKFKVKEGGELYLIGFRDLNRKVRLVLGRLV